MTLTLMDVMTDPTHEEMLEEAERREKENKVLDIAKNLMEEHKEAFQHLAAIERKELAEKGFEELTTNEKIQLALEEIDWIVIGGQDGQEFYGSIQFLRKVLRSLVTPEQPWHKDTPKPTWMPYNTFVHEKR
jgi:hypothetical protein